MDCIDILNILHHILLSKYEGFTNISKWKDYPSSIYIVDKAAVNAQEYAVKILDCIACLDIQQLLHLYFLVQIEKTKEISLGICIY